MRWGATGEWRSLLACALLTTGACGSSATPAAPSPAAPRTIVAFGDSLTSGHGIGEAAAYPAILQEYLRREALGFTVVNAGVSGDTTTTALRRLPVVLQHEPAILIVALGANDGLRGAPVAAVRRNLAHIISAARGRDAAVLLCAMAALPVHGWSYSVDFHNAYVELAREHDAPLVPFFMANVVGRRDLLLPDMVHPNARGARVIADTIWPHVHALARALAD